VRGMNHRGRIPSLLATLHRPLSEDHWAKHRVKTLSRQ
jgi:hypothetical protein